MLSQEGSNVQRKTILSLPFGSCCKNHRTNPRHSKHIQSKRGFVYQNICPMSVKFVLFSVKQPFLVVFFLLLKTPPRLKLHIQQSYTILPPSFPPPARWAFNVDWFVLLLECGVQQILLWLWVPGCRLLPCKNAWLSFIL